MSKRGKTKALARKRDPEATGAQSGIVGSAKYPHGMAGHLAGGHDELRAELRATTHALAAVRGELQESNEQLSASEEELRAVNAELRASNEQLRASEEGLLALNEELQSSNEELRTSDEELRALNAVLSNINAELQAKAAQAEANSAELRTLFAGSPVATLFLDHNQRVTGFSPAARRLYRLIDADLGRPIADLAPRFSGFDLPTDARAASKTGELLEREVRSLDGKRTFIVRTQPHHGAPSAGSAATVTTFVDVTSLKGTEDRIRMRSELLQLSSDAILVWRPDWATGVSKLELWNRGAEELYGYSADEAVGECPHQLLCTEPSPSRDPIQRELRETGRWEGRLVQQTRGGRTVIVSGKLRLLRDEQGGERILQTNRDVSAQVRAEGELRESEERLRFANQAAGVSAFELDAVRGTLRWFSRPTWLRAGESAPAAFDDLLASVRPEHAAQVRRALDRAIRHAPPETIREELALLDQKRWLLLIAQEVPRGAADPAVAHVGGVLVDISAKRESERALVVAEKLHSLGILAAGIAHDFNNLLMGLLANIELAMEATHDLAVREPLEHAFAAHGRATALTRQLLTFAKGGAPCKTSGDLAALVESSVTFALAGSSCSAVFHVRERVECAFDGDQLARVFENIAINARQAMPEGGVVGVVVARVAIAADGPTGLPAGDYVRVSIRDQGPGMSEATLAHVFDPFFTTKSSGSGLGLSTAYSIVRQHDGAVQIESAPGEGSVFHVVLPAARGTIDSAPPRSEEQVAFRGRVLVMDDQEIVRDAIADSLRMRGCEVITAREGAEAVDAMRAEAAAGRRLDAVMLDLTVPGGRSGRDVVGEIHALDAAVPILAMSGYAEDPIMAQPKRFGFAASVAKPLTLRELMRVLASLVTS